jgi:hypothetical protein
MQEGSTRMLCTLILCSIDVLLTTRRATSIWKLLEWLLKWAKVDGCKPSFQARLSKILSIYSTQLQEELSSFPSIGPIGIYFGKLVELLLKQAKVDGCKPSFQARLSRSISISPKYLYTAYYNPELQGSGSLFSSIGPLEVPILGNY